MVAGFDLSPIADGSAQGTVDGTALVTVLGTKVKWQGEAQIFGRLASVAGGLLEPLGKKSDSETDRRIAGGAGVADV
jgi:carbon monoxide dehydrogenase subunit G